MPRQFEDKPAVRGHVPLLIGLAGPSSSGKTFSALRLATGIQRVVGGDIFVIDTEARRALNYADYFKFQHLQFDPPFSPADYLAALEHCVQRGAKSIIVDSASYEHEGPGGVLAMQDKEWERLGRSDKTKFLSWVKPKAERQKLIGAITRMQCNTIFCFRAKEKIKIVTGKDPVSLGYMPIAGDNFIYEMTVKCLLLPGACGVPSWQPEHIGEKAIVKLPEQFRKIFAKSEPLSEDIGAQLAEWAAGVPPVNVDEMLEQYAGCNRAELDVLETSRKEFWRRLAKPAKEALKKAADAAGQRLMQRPEDAPEQGDLTT